MSKIPTPAGATEALCRSCGKRILWIVTDEGTRVPLDPVPPVYALRWTPATRMGEHPSPSWQRTTPTFPAYVSHFATCPNPKPFSGRNRTPRDGQESRTT